MTKLAPRQGIFAIILLVSFIAHLLVLVFNTEKQQSDFRYNKGEKIVEQLSKEAMASVINQDRISLSVLLNRYQVDNEIANLIITDKDNRILASIGQTQNKQQNPLEKDIIQNNQKIGQVIITMKAVVKSEIIGSQLFFILASLILHIIIWLCYGYTSRPTKEQLLLVQQKIQENMLKNQQLNNQTQLQSQRGQDLVESTDTSQEMSMPTKSINDYLFTPPKMPAVASKPLETESPISNSTTVEVSTDEPKTQVTIHFFDENGLLKHIAPELSEPYYQFCEELLQQTIYHLFNVQQSSETLRPYTEGVTVERLNSFSMDGVMFNLLGDTDKLALAGVLVGKLFVILNQVMYEKHRELQRFALPAHVGIGSNQQTVEIHQLMNNHGQEDGILLRLPDSMITTLHGNVQLRNLRSASTLAEREMLYYDGLSAVLMEALIAERDKILKYTK